FFLLLLHTPTSTLFPYTTLFRSNQITVVNLVPAQVVLKSALEDAEDLAVHIVFGGSKQQQSADHPAKITSSGGTSSLLLAECVGDRKSTRLNSSHVAISYAVFCL